MSKARYEWLKARIRELEAALRREQRDLNVCYRVIQAAQEAPGASLPRDIFESWLDDLLNDPTATVPPDSEPAEGGQDNE